MDKKTQHNEIKKNIISVIHFNKMTAAVKTKAWHQMKW